MIGQVFGRYLGGIWLFGWETGRLLCVPVDDSEELLGAGQTQRHVPDVVVFHVVRALQVFPDVPARRRDAKVISSSPSAIDSIECIVEFEFTRASAECHPSETPRKTNPTNSRCEG